MSDNKVQLFTSADGVVSLEVSRDQETVWLSQAQMAELFGTKRPAITKHLDGLGIIGCRKYARAKKR